MCQNWGLPPPCTGTGGCPQKPPPCSVLLQRAASTSTGAGGDIVVSPKTSHQATPSFIFLPRCARPPLLLRAPTPPPTLCLLLGGARAPPPISSQQQSRPLPASSSGSLVLDEINPSKAQLLWHIREMRVSQPLVSLQRC